MKKIILYLWQLPQNLLGLLVILFTHAKYFNAGYWLTPRYGFGVCLGSYIIFGQAVNQTSIKHERGHQKQSLYLGWFYLIIIGLPSLAGNLFDRLFHGSWNTAKRLSWYYNLPWERWADKLGEVKRSYSLWI